MELQSAKEESRSPGPRAPAASEPASVTEAQGAATEASAEVSAEPAAAEAAAVGVAAVGVPLADIELQAPCPWYESLEWQFAQLAWQEFGLSPFLEDVVPYHVNNSGRTSQHAAAVLFENLCESEPPPGPIRALELGAGSGVFARLFLDAFRERCAEHGRDFYARLRFLVTDQSARTLEQWRERGIFRGHEAQVIYAQVDALQPSVARVEGSEQPVRELRAVFCNYLLDQLPATIWRRRNGQVEELLLRSGVSSQAVSSQAALGSARALTPEEMQARIAGGQLKELLPVLPHLQMEMQYAPPRPLERWGAAAQALLEELGEDARLAINFGALDCVQRSLACLATGGFVLINDYGTGSAARARKSLGPQRFGSTLALGVTFPLLERGLGALGFCVAAAPGDEERGIHTRLCSHSPLPRTQRVLDQLFSKAADDAIDAPMALAREHSAAGREQEAFAAYRVALEHAPRDWHVLGEVSEYVGLGMHDYETGCTLAQRALQLNPWTSTALWNVLGDCLFRLGHEREAHAAFLKARGINPRDLRTNYNLSQTFAQQAKYEEGLRVLATGLAFASGAYRTLLLQQQVKLLTALEEQRTALQQVLQQRARGFSSD